MIEGNPPLVVRCRVQAFIMPLPDKPEIQRVILDDLITWGIRVDGIMLHNRVVPNSFYAFGETVDTKYISLEKFDLNTHKSEITDRLKKALFVSRNFNVSESSVRLLGCSVEQLK